MQNRLWAILSSLTIAGLVLTACAPAGPASSPVAAPTVAAGATPVPLPPTPSPAAEKPRYGGTLITQQRADASNFDGHQERTFHVQQPLSSAYSLLVQNDPQDDSKIVPDLAERWEMSPDGKVWTFYLHKGVKFHDGKPATSADVKVSFDRIVRPPKGIRSPRAAQLKSVEKIEALDENTVRFVLKYPQGSFLTMVASTYNWIYPKHVLDERGDMTRVVVGTGPFKFKDYSRGVRWEMVKNPDYFVQGRPYLDGITRYIIADDAAIFAALRTHRIQLLTLQNNSIRPEERAILQRESPQVQSRAGLIAPFRVFFNVTKPPFDDVRVRRAVDLVYDRQASVKVVLHGDGVVAAYLQPGTGWEIPREELLQRPGYRQPKDADIATAKKLLAEAGYPDGFKTRVLSRNEQRYQDNAIFLKNELAKIGIDVTLDNREDAVFYARSSAHDFALLNHAGGTPVADPDGVIGDFFLKGQESNWAGYESPKMEELFVKQLQTVNVDERRKLLREIENTLLEDVPATIYWWSQSYAFWWPEVKGWVPQSTLYLNHQYRDVWLAQ